MFHQEEGPLSIITIPFCLPHEKQQNSQPWLASVAGLLKRERQYPKDCCIEESEIGISDSPWGGHPLKERKNFRSHSIGSKGLPDEKESFLQPRRGRNSHKIIGGRVVDKEANQQSKILLECPKIENKNPLDKITASLRKELKGRTNTVK